MTTEGKKDGGSNMTIDNSAVSVIDFRKIKWKSFSIGSPENNDIVQVIIFLEGSDIVTKMFEMFEFVLWFKDIVSSIFLISSNEVPKKCC